MKDIEAVLRHKQAKHAQLAKEIEMLQQAAEKLREVAPLLADGDEDDAVVLSEPEEEARQLNAMAAKASSTSAQTQAAPAMPGRGTVPRWP